MTSLIPAGQSTVRAEPFSWRFTTPLFIGSALNPVNSSMIATALVPIAAGLHIPVGQTASLVTALYLASAIAQPTAGKAAEVFGARRAFLAGIVLVLLGGVLGGAARNLVMLLIARVLIGLGTSCAYPSAMMLIQRRAKAAGMENPPGGVLGGLQIAGIATASLGLPIGGVLVEAAGWRWVFLVNVPVALIALAAALIWIPRDPARQAPENARGIISRIDLSGIIGFALAMTALLAFLFSLPDPNWILLAAAVVMFAVLTWWELRARYPFVDVRLLVRNAALTRTYLRYALVALCVYAVLYGITQWLEAGRGISAFGAGLLLLPMSVISGVVVAPISRRNLVRGPVIVAALASLVGSAGVLFLTSDTKIVSIVVITLVFGVALGTAASGNQIALYTQAPPGQLGVASGLFRTSGYAGSIASSAITGIAFHNSVSDGGVHLIALVMIGVSILAVALSILDRGLRNPGPRARPAQREGTRTMPANPLGLALRNRRAGQHTLVWARPDLQAPETFTLTSPAFEHGAPIPGRHRGRLFGANISPALAWTPPPAGTAELVLIVQDPDVPLGKPATHALTLGIDPSLSGIPENGLTDPSPVRGLKHGKSGLGRRGWAGPRPVRSHGPHSYVFQLFALDYQPELPGTFTLTDVLHAMTEHVIARARLDGSYEIR